MEKVYKVWEVNTYIKMCLDSEEILHNIMIEGEISNFKHHSSGHMYFSLKDNQATIRCVCFKSNANRILFRPENGMKVILQGNISAYERDGIYQVYVNNITPKGSGEIALALEQLKARLAEEGLFDISRKKPLPSFVKKIGVLSAQTGAVIQDICHVTSSRNPYVNIILYPTFVQGSQAAQSIIKGIDFFNSKYQVDVIIIARGGGSKEDLWCFNDEALLRKIVSSKIPIITAVGHETDTTLVDYASDVRAATPSQAAELAVPEFNKLQDYLLGIKHRLDGILTTSIRIRQSELNSLVNNSLLVNPESYFSYKREALVNKGIILDKNIQHLIDLKRQILLMQTTKLEGFDPLKILKRGYASITQNGNNINRLSKLDKDHEFTIEFYDGNCTAKVAEKKNIAEET